MEQGSRVGTGVLCRAVHRDIRPSGTWGHGALLAWPCTLEGAELAEREGLQALISLQVLSPCLAVLPGGGGGGSLYSEERPWFNFPEDSTWASSAPGFWHPTHPTSGMGSQEGVGGK